MLQQQFSYELQSKPFYQLQLCLAIAINHNHKQLIAGDYTQIKLFQFQDGVLRLLKILNNSGDITTLNYFKTKQNFISGSYDALLTLWPQTNISSSKYLVKLPKCSDSINCLVIHPSEDLIICGSNSIEFWSSYSEIAQHQQWVQYQTISHENSVYLGLSLNQNGNELISCGNNNIILVMKGSNTQKWIIIKTINVDNNGARLAYISDGIFGFQPYKSNYLQIYTSNKLSGDYNKSQDIPVKGGNESCYEYFSCIYIPQKQIILSKNGQTINIIHISSTKSEQEQDMQFNLLQSIQFKTQSIFGTMSDNGEYLITWDYHTGQIQVRKYMKKQ
ncbi:unnamed protein product [Paramecium primaurelia]|uniref:Uncharacterized protein n=1 Tax=Paramecium primaurelia TaxID=5886 RepID=A0A8S1PEZ0_PARPR|nr:unnamed protein product [Paramecium primaurelia]